MIDYKISVIVPVYNVEKYLRRCVDSIINQTYSNIEIILVDDGSLDSSPQICEDLAEEDSRIVVIHQTNSGLAGARNTGINAASGDYIGFVDSDDWIENDTYEHCMDLINKYEADIVQFQLGYAFNEIFKFEKKKERIEVIKGKEILQHYMYCTTTGKGGDYSVCICLFKNELLHDIRFREGKINEDVDFKYKAFSNAKTLINTNLSKYYYFQQSESLSMGGLKKKDFDLYEVGDVLAELTSKENYGDIAKLGRVKQARTPLSLLCKIAAFGISDSNIDKNKVVDKLTKELRRNFAILILSPLPLSRKALTVFFCVNYKVTERIIQFLK